MIVRVAGMFEQKPRRVHVPSLDNFWLVFKGEGFENSYFGKLTCLTIRQILVLDRLDNVVIVCLRMMKYSINSLGGYIGVKRRP